LKEGNNAYNDTELIPPTISSNFSFNLSNTEIAPGMLTDSARTSESKLSQIMKNIINFIGSNETLLTFVGIQFADSHVLSLKTKHISGLQKLLNIDSISKFRDRICEKVD